MLRKRVRWTSGRPRIQNALAVGGVSEDIIAPLPGELFSETNDNSVAILLTYGPRPPLAGNAEAREEDYMAEGSYTRP